MWASGVLCLRSQQAETMLLAGAAITCEAGALFQAPCLLGELSALRFQDCSPVAFCVLAVIPLAPGPVSLPSQGQMRVLYM